MPQHQPNCEDRTRELMALINVQQALASRQDIQEVLQLIADESRRLTHTDISALFLPDDDGLALAVVSSEKPVSLKPGYRVSLTHSASGIAFRTGTIQLVPNVQTHPTVDAAAMSKIGARSILAIPLKSGVRVIGVLSVANALENTLDGEEERLLTLMAPSAVIALENARRFEQIREVAAAEERGRLARDLHDAVTQTLFSASLTAEVLPRIWERDPQEGMKRLEKLRELTRGALAEMRTLLLELRPSALTQAPLCELLRQLAEGIAGRTRIQIDVNVKDKRALQADAQVSLYRIAQEALNNVAKHSNATQAQVDLQFDERQVRLQIVDNGCGFDPSANKSQNLGLRIMAERAQAIGADLSVETHIGQGTCIEVLWVEKDV
jgi:signal transduction histidine kinase